MPHGKKNGKKHLNVNKSGCCIMLNEYSDSYCSIMFNSFNNRKKKQFNVIRRIVFEITVCTFPTFILKLYVLLELFPFQTDKKVNFYVKLNENSIYCRNRNPVIGFITRLTRQVSHVEQDLPFRT